MYTNGILKIFRHEGYYGNINVLFDLAKKAKYRACSHNGKIYILHSEQWIETCFELSDFQTATE